MDTTSGTSLEVRSPFPGLRPFLDTESSIFFGRESQVQQVIEHLRATRFIALLGGSGSGKSSLIRAGVLPTLRGYGIREAGDFWVPVLCTPGTNLAGADLPPGQRQTPIDRLARKFVHLLRATSEEERSRWQAEAVEVLNKCDGFGGLVNTFSERLALPPGPDAEQANFVLVLDQFEELFHWSNKDVPECGTLVQRVLDHFYSPHPRVYVVITMRSEHLNDCAAFLRLPDAINKASYLVRRLDPAEIDETIERPPSRYLRMLARASGGKHKVPARFRFEQSVLSRIQHDVEAIHADPDHLALLQHLLARLWDAACFRVLEDGADVPGGATWNDLERAVSARTDGNALPVPDEANVLRLCLENWAQSIFDRFGPDDRERFDTLLRRLAFKDPNTGMYTQQRLILDEARALIDGADPRLLLAGFLPPCDYLLWDDENPDQVTIKVFHETFIRGWRHFQQLIDREAELFEEFLALLRPAQTWLETNAAGRRPLLDGEHLARVRESRLKDVLHDAHGAQRLFQLLRLKRNCECLQVNAGELTRFIDASIAADEARIERERAEARRTKELERRQREQERTIAESEAKRHRLLAYLAGAFGVVAVVTAGVMFHAERKASALRAAAQDNEKIAKLAAHQAKLSAEDARIKAKEAEEMAKVAKRNEDTAVEARRHEEEAKKDLERVLKRALSAQAEARNQAEEATRQRNRASSLRLIMSADKTARSNPEVALLLGLEALSFAKSTEAMDVMRDLVESGRVQLVPKLAIGHTNAIRHVAFDPAKKRLATASDDNTIKIWDAETGKPLFNLRGHQGAVISIAFSRDGRYIASGSFDDAAIVWDAAKGTLLRRFAGHRDTVTSVAFTPDGKSLATGSEDKTAKLWDVETGNEIRSFRGHSDHVRSVAISPDGKRLATASDDGAAKLWDLSGREQLILSGHRGYIRAVAFSPDGRRVATAGDDRLVRIWDATTGKELSTLEGHTASVRSVAFDPTGRYIATGSADRSAKIWDVASAKIMRSLDVHQDIVNAVAFSADGALLATGSGDRSARLWDTGTGEMVVAIAGAPSFSEVSASRFSPDALRIASASESLVVIWDALKGNELARLSGHTEKVSALAFDPGGNLLATASGKSAKLWSANKPDATARDLPDFEYPVTAVSFTPDSKAVAVGMENGVVVLLDTASGRELMRLNGHEAKVLAIAFSPEGRRIATGSGDRTARLWDATTGNSIRTFEGHAGELRAATKSDPYLKAFLS